MTQPQQDMRLVEATGEAANDLAALIVESARSHGKSNGTHKSSRLNGHGQSGNGVSPAESGQKYDLEQLLLVSLVDNVRNELHRFILGNMRPPAKMGFLVPGADQPETVRIDRVLNACIEAEDKLEAMMLMADNNPHAIVSRIFVPTLQHHLEGFMLDLKSSDFADGVPEPEVDEVVRRACVLKEVMGNALIRLRAMAAGVEIG